MGAGEPRGELRSSKMRVRRATAHEKGELLSYCKRYWITKGNLNNASNYSRNLLDNYSLGT
jgi:hypothetical protein